MDGWVEKNRPGRRDPEGAQVVAAKRRTPRGNHKLNHNWVETGRPRRETNKETKLENIMTDGITKQVRRAVRKEHTNKN